MTPRTSFHVCCWVIIAFGNMQPSQQMCSSLRSTRPLSSRSQNPACRTMSSLPFGSCGRQWRPVLSCEPDPFTVPSFCATWKSIVHGRSARVIFFSPSSSAALIRPVEVLRQDPIVRRVVAHREEQRVRHVGLEPDASSGGRPPRAARRCASRCACRPSRSLLRPPAARRSPRRCPHACRNVSAIFFVLPAGSVAQSAGPAAESIRTMP